MATYDWTGTDVIPNGSGSAVRADLNDALLALFSQNSGNDAPTTTVGYMLWADPDDGYLKIRDGSDSAIWYNLFKLNGEWDPLKLVSGTFGAPSLQFSNSGTNTGLYSPAPYQVGVTTAGGLRARFSSSEIVFNEITADVDFRVAGTTQPNLFKVDAGTNTVTITTLSANYIAGTTIQGTIKSGTAVASTSGTSIDFTGIPSWVKRVTVMFADISLSGSASILIQLGDSGGIETTGYVSSSNYLHGGVTSGSYSSANGLVLYAGASTNALTGAVSIVNITGNNWIGTGTYNYSSLSGYNGFTAGNKTLSSTLDRIRITSDGADTFDGGTINILYEG